MGMSLPFPLTPVSLLNLLALTINNLTFYSSILLHLLPPREPLVIIAQVNHHVDHGIVHFDCPSIWDVVFQLKLSVRCEIIQLGWFHACMWIPLTALALIPR